MTTAGRNLERAAIIGRVIANGHYLTKMLGNPPAVGLSLMEAYYSGDPWLTAQEAADRALVSEDTARRRLNDLTKVARAVTQGVGKRLCYRINPRTAETVMRRVEAIRPKLKGS